MTVISTAQPFFCIGFCLFFFLSYNGEKQTRNSVTRCSGNQPYASNVYIYTCTSYTHKQLKKIQIPPYKKKKNRIWWNVRKKGDAFFFFLCPVFFYVTLEHTPSEKKREVNFLYRRAKLGKFLFFLRETPIWRGKLPRLFLRDDVKKKKTNPPHFFFFSMPDHFLWCGTYTIE